MPWLGYYHRIGLSDTHVILDHVQFEKNSFTNRNKIRIPDGWTWLTIPLRTKGKFGQLQINQLQASNELWRKKHWTAIMLNYAKAPFFKTYAPLFEEIYQQDTESFFDTVDKMNRLFMEQLNLQTKILYSSQMNPSKTKSDLVLELCLKANATVYLSGTLGREYLDLDSFARHDIRVVFQNYMHPEYQQVYQVFEPYMAIIDLLFNHGPSSRDILFENQKEIL